MTQFDITLMNDFVAIITDKREFRPDTFVRGGRIHVTDGDDPKIVGKWTICGVIPDRTMALCIRETEG